jgi:hypothetical protein
MEHIMDIKDVKKPVLTIIQLAKIVTVPVKKGIGSWNIILYLICHQ